MEPNIKITFLQTASPGLLCDEIFLKPKLQVVAEIGVDFETDYIFSQDGRQ